MDSEFKLYLYPENPDFQAKINALESLFIKIGLTSHSLDKNRYATGDNFASLLTFMGCSPNIELEPQDDKPYCYIEMNSVKQAQFISGTNTKYPPCPNCKETLIAQICANCNESLDVTKPNWRKTAFLASSWITIGNIYELEAIPSDQLLNALKTETGIKWKPAYIRQKVESE